MELSIEAFLSSLAGVWPLAGYVLMIAGGLVVAGRLYIYATPSQDDDAWLQSMEAVPFVGALLRALAAFSPVARKPGPESLSKKKK